MAQTKILLLFSLCLTNQCAFCCDCEYFDFYWDYGSSTNISLAGNVYLTVLAFQVYHCREVDVQWEIVRADGEVELYRAQPQGDYYDLYFYEEFEEEGLVFSTYCDFYCRMQMTLSPTDLRYNGAQVTCNFSLPECNISNITNPTTVNIQGLLEAPMDVNVEGISLESVAVFWSPPFTLDGVPILQYSVYTTSRGISEQFNTTETNIVLGRPCSRTTYQISAWNEVGEGNTTTFELFMYDAVVKTIDKKQELCLSCAFLISPILESFAADGCSLKLQSESHTFVFNITRHNDKDLVLLECFSIPEPGEYSVHVYEIQNGNINKYTSRKLENIVISEKGYSLISAEVVSVVGGMCASCYFTNDTTAKGCTVNLYNEENAYYFNMSRESHTILKCFEVPTQGVFNVVVYEVPMDESMGYNTLELSDITVISQNSTKQPRVADTSSTAVISVSAVLGIVLVCVTVALLTVLIFLVRRRIHNRGNTTPDSPGTTSISSAPAETTNPTYENIQLPAPTPATGEDNMYEHVELKPIPKQEKAIELAPNAAYGTVRR